MGCELTYTCPECGFSLGVWDAGYRSYIIDPTGKKHQIMHPGEQEIIEFYARQYPEAPGMSHSQLLDFAEQHIVHRQRGICLDCAKGFTGPESPSPKKCRSCKSSRTIWLADIGGKPCPKCKTGHFPQEGTFTTIS